MAHSTTGLVIFDCDGVLIDSEMLSASVLMGLLAEAGYPIDFETFRADFLGRSFASAVARTEAKTTRKLPGDFQSRYHERLLHQFKRHLCKMDDVDAVLESIRVPYCLASSSSPERLE